MQSVQAAVLVALACLLVACSAAKSPGSDSSPVNNNPFVFPKTSNRQTICLYDGCVQGKSEEGNVRGYDAWYGIPFATPPLGPLRFRSPVPPPSWGFLWNATYPRSACMQRDLITQQVSGSEDCLYLNVYRPKLASRKKRLPVLVFIHGGSFKLGSADPSLYGPEFFMDTQEVIVVTIQYRLGVFGFLAADHESCKGNFGLKDQNMALYWVRGNIRAFGGDHRQVTIMGQSAGAASVQYQMISKRSNGLFQRGIMLSGSALAFWAIRKDPETLFRQYAALAGIPNAQSESPRTIVHLLRLKSAQELMEYQEAFPSIHMVMPLFRPVIERKWRGAFIRHDPEYIWESGRFEHRPFLTGVTGYEEGVFGDLYYNETLNEGILANFDYSIQTAMEVPKSAVGPIRDFYFDGEPTEQNMINILRVRERFMDYPMYKTVADYVQYADLKEDPVDLYHFNFTTPFSFCVTSNPYPIAEKGACHSDDLMYLFSFKVFDGVFVRDEPENEMKNYFVRYIVDYVKYGLTPLNRARPCRPSAMKRGFCEYTDIQRDYTTMPNKVKASVSNQFDMQMVKFNQYIDRLIAREEDQ